MVTRKLVVLLLTTLFLSGLNAKAAEDKIEKKAPDYIQERIDAMAFAKKRKYQEALDAFIKMSETPEYSDFQKTDALEQAVIQASKLKKFDQALELAEKIPMKDVAKACKMLVYIKQRNYKQLIDEFKDEDISTWPYSQRAEGYTRRGTAYKGIKQYEKAVKDLEKAGEASWVEDEYRGNAYKNIAGIYVAQKDTKNAIKYLKKATHFLPVGRYTFFQSLLSLTKMYRETNNYSKAIKAIMDIKPYDLRGGTWKFAIIHELAEVYEDMGNNDKALEVYEKALLVKGADEKAIAKVNQKIEQMKTVYGAPVDIVVDGKANAEIIIAKEPLVSVKLSAENLQSFIEQISGAKLEIVNAPTGNMPNTIYLGQSEAAKQLGMSIEDLKPEGYKIMARRNIVAVIGHDIEREPFPYTPKGARGLAPYEEPLKKWYEYYGDKTFPCGASIGHFNRNLGFYTQDATATLYGVSNLLEQMGVRFYYPYENGTVVPEKKTISIRGQFNKFEPQFPFRFPNYYGSMRTDTEGVLWLKRLGYGSSDVPQFSGHSMRNIMNADGLKEGHPEYVAKDSEGKMIIGHNGPVPKLTNPALRKEAMKYMRKNLDAYPPMVSMTLGMPDGFTHIDAEDSKIWVKEDSGYTAKFSNYVWDFWLYAAKELKKSHPDKFLNTFSYTTYQDPPTIVDKLPDNISLCFVYTSAYAMVPTTKYIQNLRKKWLNMLTSDKLYGWEHLLFYRKGRPRTPAVYTKILQKEMQDLYTICEDIFAEVQPGFNKKGRYNGRLGMPGLMHLLHYIKGKLYWDPYLDMDKLLNEYYEKFFGPAAAEMKEFYEFSEEVWTRPETRSITIVKGFLKEKDVDKYFEILSRAREKAGKESVYDKRIAVIEEEMQPLKKLFPNLVRTGPDFRAYPMKGKIALDGKLDDETWNYVNSWHPMVELVTGEAVPDLKASKVAFRVENKNLYIGIKCFENKMEKVKASTGAHDDFDIFNDDVVEIYIETPERSYFKIVVNTTGAIWDESFDSTIIERDTKSDLWNPGVEAGVFKGEDFFSIEIKIPTDDFGALGPKRPYPWGINVCRMRFTGGEPEAFATSPTGKMRFAVMTKLGNLYLE